MDQKTLGNTEEITKYLYEGDFSETTKNIKATCCKPKKDSDAISTIRTGSIDVEGCDRKLGNNEIWEYGEQYVGTRFRKNKECNIIARVDFKASNVNKIDGLDIYEDSRGSNPRHSQIKPFPRLTETMSEDSKNYALLRINTLKTRLQSSLSQCQIILKNDLA